MFRSRIVMALLGGASAVGLVIAGGGVASAGQVAGCQHNNYCFSYQAGGHGATTSFTDYSLNIAPAAFPYNGTGGGRPVADDSHWAADYSITRVMYVYFYTGCTGASDGFSPGASGNLGPTQNNNESYCTY